MPQGTQPEIAVRPAVPEDAVICGQICYEAFSAINSSHGFALDFPEAAIPTRLLSMMFSQPGWYSIVAESAGRIVGSNALDERSVICGVGPITIDPRAQNSGVGRKLMQTVMGRAQQRGAAGIRLTQAAFHNRSLALYASLGFVVREPLSCMQGRTHTKSVPGCAVRQATAADADACNALSRRIHGFDRAVELSQATEHGHARVVERDGCVTGYTTHLAFFGHSTAETNIDLQALLASAEAFAGPGVLIPERNHELFRWCLKNGLRVVQPLTLMSTGFYSEPSGAWLPSVIF